MVITGPLTEAWKAGMEMPVLPETQVRRHWHSLGVLAPRPTPDTPVGTGILSYP